MKTCTICNENEVTSTKKSVDFCRNCFYTGAALEREFGQLIGDLEAVDGVSRATVWHTGGGCFVLAVNLDDGRLITATALEDGEVGAVMPDAPEGPWGYVLSEDEAAWSDWDEDRIKLRSGPFTDLPAAVREAVAA